MACNPSVERIRFGIACNRISTNISSRKVSSCLPMSLSSNLCFLWLTQGPWPWDLSGLIPVRAILGQRVDKKFNVIHYASKTLDSAQKNYTTTEKEFLAVVFSCDKFRQYIFDSKVIIYADHAAIKYLM